VQATGQQYLQRPGCPGISLLTLFNFAPARGTGRTLPASRDDATGTDLGGDT